MSAPNNGYAQPVYAAPAQGGTNAPTPMYTAPPPQYAQPYQNAPQPGSYVGHQVVAPPANFHDSRANAVCKQCGTIYQLPVSASSWRCKNCGKFNSISNNECCVIL